jgi:hypothetical protein
MKRRNRIIAAVLVLVVISGLMWMALREPPEPVYQGKTLNVWLEQYQSYYSMKPADGGEEQARVAIQRIGTNALPLYLKMITAKESAFELKLTKNQSYCRPWGLRQS